MSVWMREQEHEERQMEAERPAMVEAFCGCGASLGEFWPDEDPYPYCGDCQYDMESAYNMPGW